MWGKDRQFRISKCRRLKFELPLIRQKSTLLKKASNKQLTLLRKLRSRKYREQEKLFIVEGERALKQVLESKKVKLHSIFLEEHVTTDFSEAFFLDSALFDEVSNTENPQGVLGIFHIPNPITIEELKKQKGVVVAVDAIQDPGNLGTIIRTASWFNAVAFLSGKGTVDMFNPKVVRSTVGATGAIPYLSLELDESFQQLEESGWKVVLLDGNPGSIPIIEIPSSDKIILVVGNEANGISKSLISPKRTRALIPASGDQNAVESLNAAVALSIGLWHVNN